MQTLGFTASRFPGIDEAKFEEWKKFEGQFHHWHGIRSSVIWTVIVIWFFFKPPSWPPWIFSMVVFVTVEFGFSAIGKKRLFQLREELKMFERIRAMKKGKPFTK